MPVHPLTSDDGLKDAARTTLRELLQVAKRYKRRRERLESLFLFESRKRAGRHAKEVPRASVVFEDTPEMELILKHRDDYERLGKLFDLSERAMEMAVVEPQSAKALVSLTFNINRLEAQRECHLEAIREILAQLSRELASQEAVLAKVVAEGAKLSQLAQINSDRNRTALETRGMGSESRSNTELLQIAKEIQGRIADGTYEGES